MEILLILVVGALNVACFFIGARVGQKVVKGEDVKLPNPVQSIRESLERRESAAEQNRIDIILQNIETYDGTGIGQQDVPR